MRQTKKLRLKGNHPESVEARPEVIVDFECEQDLLYIVVANVGSSSAHRVFVKFDKEIKDFRGIRMSGMDIFRKLEFLAPGRKIRLFVDSYSRYIKRKQPLQLRFSLTYFDRMNLSYSDTIRHNLGIFKGLVHNIERGNTI